MKECPCRDCPYRKATCHDYCREYIDWHDERVKESKARAFDLLMEKFADDIIWRNRLERRRRS